MRRALLLILLVPAMPAAAIPGRVVDAQGRSVAGAAVATQGDREGRPGVVLPAPNGAFTLPDIVRDTCVAALAPGHAPAAAWVSPGDTGVVLHLPAPRTLAGHVYGPDGRPCEGVTVRLAALAADRRAAGESGAVGPERAPLPEALRERTAARTGADGAFRLDAVPPGRVWLGAMDPRFARETVERLEGPANFRLRAGCRVRGSVTGPQGPMAGLRVVAYESVTGAAAMSAVSGKDGSFLLCGLPAGVYDIGADLPADGPYAVAAAHAVLSQAAPECEVGLRASPGGVVTMRAVETKSGAPLPGVPLLAWGAHRPDPASASLLSGPDGTARARVPAGQVRVTRTNGDGRLYLGFSVGVAVKDGEEATTTLEARPTRQIAGGVVDGAGRPVAGAAVEVRQYDQESWWARTDARGRFVIRGTPGGAEVTITARRDEEGLPAPERIAEGSSAPLRLALGPLPRVVLSGRVVDGAGQPVSGIPVRLGEFRTKDNPAGTVPIFARTLLTSPDGRYHFVVRLPASDYRVSVDPDAGEQRGGGESRGDQGPERRFADLVVERHDRVLRGRVVDAAGKPVAGAILFRVGSGPRQMAVSGPDGAFHIEGLGGQAVPLGARCPGRGECLTRVAPGAEATLVLTPSQGS